MGGWIEAIKAKGICGSATVGVSSARVRVSLCLSFVPIGHLDRIIWLDRVIVVMHATNCDKLLSAGACHYIVNGSKDIEGIDTTFCCSLLACVQGFSGSNYSYHYSLVAELCGVPFLYSTVMPRVSRGAWKPITLECPAVAPCDYYYY